MPAFLKYDVIDGDAGQRSVTDGTSNTLMLSEKYIPASHDGGYVLTGVQHSATMPLDTASPGDWFIT